MKMVTAIIPPAKLDSVREALVAADITRLTVTRATGHGRQRSEAQIYRGQIIVPDLKPQVRLDIACNDEFVDIAIEAIIKGAREGSMGDGKIFVTPIEQVVRISTGDRGGSAI